MSGAGMWVRHVLLPLSRTDRSKRLSAFRERCSLHHLPRPRQPSAVASNSKILLASLQHVVYKRVRRSSGAEQEALHWELYWMYAMSH
jgi:hypothetical protein